MTHGEAAVTGQGTQRAEPALGQGPGLPPRLGVPFVLRTPVPDRRRKDSCAWEPEPPLLRSPNPRRWQAPPAELDALFCLLSPGGLPPRASPASASSLQGCRLLTAWRPSLHLSRLGQVWSSLRVPQTLEKMGEGGLQWPWGRGRREEASPSLWGLSRVPSAWSSPAPLQGWAPLPILRTRSASALCLPAALRLTQRPSWGRGGACGHPHSVALLLTSDLGLHRMLPEGPQHRLLGPAPEFPTLWVWMGPGLLRFWQVPSGVCPWLGVRAGEPLTPGAVGVGGCVVRPPPPARRPRSRSHFTGQKHSLQSKFQ